MRISLWILICCAFVLSVFSAIGEATNSGVSTTKKVEEATDQEAKKMCDSYRKDAKEIRKGNCTLDGLANAKDKEECNAIRSDCLERINKESSDPYECTEVDITDLAGCKATVGDVEACFSRLVDYAKSLSCNDFGKELKAPSDCLEDLQTKCGKISKDV